MFLPFLTGHQRRFANHIYCIVRPLDVVAGIFMWKFFLINLNNWTCALHQCSLRLKVKGASRLCFGRKIIKHSICSYELRSETMFFSLSLSISWLFKKQVRVLRSEIKENAESLLVYIVLWQLSRLSFVYRKHNIFLKIENYLNIICTHSHTLTLFTQSRIGF